MEKKKYYRCVPGNNGSYAVEEVYKYGPGKNWYLTKESAVEHYNRALKKALEKYEKIANGIQDLKDKLGGFSCDCEVSVLDDSGLTTEMYITFEVEGYRFKFF